MRFRTEDLPLAAFICAKRRLPFLGCESGSAKGRVAFVFEDTHDEGDRLHIEFESAQSAQLLHFTTACDTCVG
jgi:hypothetical protein